MRSLLLLIAFLFISSVSAAQQLLDSIRLQPSIIDQIVITGNRRTREYIVNRELTFHVGDTLQMYILESAIEQSRQNLMNIALFNFVDIKYFQGLNNHVVIHINLTERWYLWPSPVFEIADRNFTEWFHKKDFSRSNYGMYLRQDNFTGRDDILQAQALFGYSRRLGLYYTIPYLNKKLTWGLSTGFYMTRQKEIAYNTLDNKLQFYKNPDDFVREEMQTYVRFTKRKGMYNYYNTTIDYRRSEVADTVPLLNPHYFDDGGTIQQHIGIAWSYRYDRRDYQPYALKGVLYELEVAKTGIGILPHEPDIWALAMGLRYYKPLGGRWYTGAAVKGRILQRDQGPYFNRRALGYGLEYIRGYDLYVLNGQDYALFRSNLKFNILPQRIYQFGFLNSSKFRRFPITMHLNGFFDAGYVSDQLFGNQNKLSNTWQYGYGMSLDLITYYDVVIRFEYAMTKVGDQGLYFRMGTVF
ncbi:MAG: POTRA domain-containing protein [Bacteroidia bacterium]